MRLVAALIAFLCAAPAMAQIEFDYAERLDTRFGEIHAVGSDFQFTLWHNQEPLPLPEDARWFVQWYAQSEAGFDWVLVSHHHGGNSCGGGASYVLRVGADGVAQSQPISDCDGWFVEIRTEGDVIELDRTDTNILVPLVTLRWQGDAYSETFHYAPPEEAAGSGADVTRWVGALGSDILEDGSERARFAGAMQIWEMQELWTRLLVGGEVMQVGDWVIATGCQPHACGLEMGAIGLRVNDGAVAAIIRSSGDPDRVFGLGEDAAFSVRRLRIGLNDRCWGN